MATSIRAGLNRCAVSCLRAWRPSPTLRSCPYRISDGDARLVRGSAHVPVRGIQARDSSARRSVRHESRRRSRLPVARQGHHHRIGIDRSGCRRHRVRDRPSCPPRSCRSPRRCRAMSRWMTSRALSVTPRSSPRLRLSELYVWNRPSLSGPSGRSGGLNGEAAEQAQVLG